MLWVFSSIISMHSHVPEGYYNVIQCKWLYKSINGTLLHIQLCALTLQEIIPTEETCNRMKYAHTMYWMNETGFPQYDEWHVVFSPRKTQVPLQWSMWLGELMIFPTFLHTYEGCGVSLLLSDSKHNLDLTISLEKLGKSTKTLLHTSRLS